MNQEFLDVLKQSFEYYLEYGARSNEKLKVLHPHIAQVLHNELAKHSNYNNEFTIHSLEYGENKKEADITGAYMNKKVDITIKKNGNPIAGIAVKYVMSNYKQNSNNYFENMLGETINLRVNNIDYFQVIILLEEMPYYNKDKVITKWESINEHNIKKYQNLSNSNINLLPYLSNLSLLCVVKYPIDKTIGNEKNFKDFYSNQKEYSFSYSDQDYSFGESFIYNDFEKFIKEVADIIAKKHLL